MACILLNIVRTFKSNQKAVGLWLTCDGRPAHQVCVGEVQGGVEQEVRLDNPSRSLTDIVEQAGAPHRHSALEAMLQGRKIKNLFNCFLIFF